MWSHGLQHGVDVGLLPAMCLLTRTLLVRQGATSMMFGASELARAASKCGHSRVGVSRLCIGKEDTLSCWQCMSIAGSLHVCWLLCWAGDGTAGDVLGVQGVAGDGVL